MDVSCRRNSTSPVSWKFESRPSTVFYARRKAEAPSKLFIRYYACEPRDGPEYEFYSDEDISTQAPEYVSLSPRTDLENAPPNEDHALSAEEPEISISLC